jgi:hypothetical protein
MADESALCAEYLYGKLNVSAVTNALGTAARIFDTIVPQNPIAGQTALFPCVVYHQQSSSDSFGIGAARIMVRPVWTVKVITDGPTFDSAATIFALVDAAIQNTSGTVTNGSIYSCYRESESIRYAESKPGGGYFMHIGAMYRIEARATTTP